MNKKIIEKNASTVDNVKDLPEHAFSKEQILKSKTVTFNKDVLNSLLSDEKNYTLKELKQIVINFNSRREEH